MQSKITGITFWRNVGNAYERIVVKRRVQDTKRFKYKGVNYTLFKNNLQNTFTLVVNCQDFNLKNYFINTEELPAQVGMTKLMKQVKRNLKKHNKSVVLHWLNECYS